MRDYAKTVYLKIKEDEYYKEQRTGLKETNYGKINGEIRRIFLKRLKEVREGRELIIFINSELAS